MRSSRRRSSDGNLGQVALKARDYQAGGVSTAVDLAEILEKKDLSEHETKVIRESMVQVRRDTKGVGDQTWGCHGCTGVSPVVCFVPGVLAP